MWTGVRTEENTQSSETESAIETPQHRQQQQRRRLAGSPIVWPACLPARLGSS